MELPGVREKLEELADKLLDDALWKELGVKVNMINGAETVPITEDMLSENERDLLVIGEITMEEIVRDRNGEQVYGDRVQEWQVTGFAKGYLSGVRATAYADEDFVIRDEFADINKAVDDAFDSEDDDDAIEI